VTVSDQALTDDQQRPAVPDPEVVREALQLVAGRWRAGVLLALVAGTRRYSELVRALPGVSDKVLTQTLRAMEQDGLIARDVGPEVPPRVEYRLTALGASLLEPLRALGRWGAGRYGTEHRARAHASAG
jgi:DNA-binding HxlR family transcriptional regulator